MRRRSIGNRTLAPVLLGACLATTGGCLVALDPDAVQCASPVDCGAGFSCIDSYCDRDQSVWSCLEEPPPRLAPGAMIRHEMMVRNGASGLPLSGARIRACELDDPLCADRTIWEGTSPEDGQISFEVPRAFDGVLLAEREGYRGGLMRLLPSESERPGALFSLFPAGLFGVLVSTAGVSADRDTTLLLVDVEDCTGALGVGVEVEVAGRVDGVPVYLRDNVLDPDATQTDEVGLGGVVDVSPGSYEVITRVAQGGQEIARTTVPVPTGFVAGATLSLFHRAVP